MGRSLVQAECGGMCGSARIWGWSPVVAELRDSNKRRRGAQREMIHTRGRALPLPADRCLHYLDTWAPGPSSQAASQA